MNTSPTPAVPPRPAGETSDSPQRAGQPMHGAVRAFDLRRELEALREEPSWQRGDRNAKTLVHEPGFRVVLTALKTGARLGEHASHGQFTVQALAGRVRVHLAERTAELPAGQLLSMEGGVVHDLEALEESAFLLTIVAPVAPRPGAGAEAQAARAEQTWVDDGGRA